MIITDEHLELLDNCEWAISGRLARFEDFVAETGLPEELIRAFMADEFEYELIKQPIIVTVSHEVVLSCFYDRNQYSKEEFMKMVENSIAITSKPSITIIDESVIDDYEVKQIELNYENFQ